jgi:polyphosphate glucokinase
MRGERKAGGKGAAGGKANPPGRRILVLDVGGTNVKIRISGSDVVHKIPSGRKMTAEWMVSAVLDLARTWRYDAVSIGYPGMVYRNRPVVEPVNLAPGWVGFDFAGAFGRPVKIINDAAMQALGSYRGGKMLFLGLGTGLGTALIWDGVLEPMELGHLHYKKGRTFEDYLGLRGLERLGMKKWRGAVTDVVERLSKAFGVDEVVLGGGHAKLLDEAPPGARLGSNANAFAGGFSLWGSAGGTDRERGGRTEGPRRPEGTGARA